MNADKPKKYYTYIIMCKDGSYYTGYSNNPLLRFEKHKAGKGAKYTRSHEPKELAFVSPALTKSEAMRAEYYIKQMTHNEKKAFIEGWPTRLARGQIGRLLSNVMSIS